MMELAIEMAVELVIESVIGKAFETLGPFGELLAPIALATKDSLNRIWLQKIWLQRK